MDSVETGWLIEYCPNGYATWWTGKGWTRDPNEAVRFCRKQDADRVIQSHGFLASEATDHMWVPG